MITYSRGSKRLAGAASLKYRMPVVADTFHQPGDSSTVEQQTHNLLVAGSIPAFRPVLNNTDPIAL